MAKETSGRYKWVYRKCGHMVKEYRIYDLDENKLLLEETLLLSEVPARYSVSRVHLGSAMAILVDVRCRRGSKAYKLCGRLGYEYVEAKQE